MLKIYNTLTKSKDVFIPIAKIVGIYSCGPTVYHYAHIGNFRTYIAEDILKRTLIYNGYKVKHVMNITDVGHLTSDADTGEDKLEKQAKKEGRNVWEISDFYTKAFKEDMHKLKILEPDVWCKATEHIKEQIEWIIELERLGYTYSTDDGIYFNSLKFKDYSIFSKSNLKGMQAGKRIEIGSKKNSTDFALWKFSPKNEKRQMEWKSPWGIGFPGWHIECSVMATKYLGKHFDIHCGGMDHIQVHHTNEIAQTEAVTKHRWVNYWFHVAFAMFNDEKMSKSKGTTITLYELEKEGYFPLEYKFFVLNTHYRKPLNISKDGIRASKEDYTNIKNKILEIQDLRNKGRDPLKYKYEFLEAINDDLDTPKAIDVIRRLLKDDDIADGNKYNLIIEFDKVLGLGFDEIKKVDIPQNIKKLIEEREQARKDKNFKLSDELRDKIKSYGFSIDDGQNGPIINKIY